MLEKCYTQNNLDRKIYRTTITNSSNEFIIDLELTEQCHLEYNILFLELSHEIVAFRNSHYQWQKNNEKESIANIHSPKIVVLSNGKQLVCSKNIGIWSISKNHPKRIKWILNHSLSTPIFFYDINGKRNFVKKFEAKNFSLKILCTHDKVPEFSRSKIPFSTIVCFTDHCDFDTQKNLMSQLSFFKKLNIIITKGFFLKQFSKREKNASYENNHKVLSEFYKNNNEMAYHSLTQSIKVKDKAISEFFHFDIPQDFNIKTYIDHGYQPYNFTQSKNYFDNNTIWANRIANIGITNLWNYVDGGTANRGMINQLNPKHFTVKRMIKHNLTDYRFIMRSLFHFTGNEELREKFKIFASKFKKFLGKKSIKNFIDFIIHFFQLIVATIKLVFTTKWNSPFYRLKYSPFIFKYEMGGHTFNMFQTLEITNFENSLSKSNIDQLIKEAGACIIHCYFSSPLPHQKGKFFKKDKIAPNIHKNFDYLSTMITKEKIWNPTINELIEFHNKLFNLEFFYDEIDNQIKSNDSSIPLRYISYV